jgi:hypothetical protein
MILVKTDHPCFRVRRHSRGCSLYRGKLHRDAHGIFHQSLSDFILKTEDLLLGFEEWENARFVMIQIEFRRSPGVPRLNTGPQLGGGGCFGELAWYGTRWHDGRVRVGLGEQWWVAREERKRGLGYCENGPSGPRDEESEWAGEVG